MGFAADVERLNLYVYDMPLNSLPFCCGSKCGRNEGNFTVFSIHCITYYYSFYTYNIHIMIPCIGTMMYNM